MRPQRALDDLERSRRLASFEVDAREFGCDPRKLRCEFIGPDEIFHGVISVPETEQYLSASAEPPGV